MAAARTPRHATTTTTEAAPVPASIGPVDPESILTELNPEQREAATVVSGPLVILAGAGTGKTRVISHRVAYAAATGTIDPKQALVVTFTDKAATEMRQRLHRLGGA